MRPAAIGICHDDVVAVADSTRTRVETRGELSAETVHALNPEKLARIQRDVEEQLLRSYTKGRIRAAREVEAAKREHAKDEGGDG